MNTYQGGKYMLAASFQQLRNVLFSHVFKSRKPLQSRRRVSSEKLSESNDGWKRNQAWPGFCVDILEIFSLVLFFVFYVFVVYL
ncbi:hypothetical protein RRG08_014746 [Elysia crispata]|uniref:Uncharacterized protein n=1 Tax=Elysia crispata TaxID=231223 RepID=A0AAE1ASS5_9GAST|nr:hypothetical protein RRG08_014746 [Elysia crispata]